MVTHEPQAAAVADRIVVLQRRRGRPRRRRHRRRGRPRPDEGRGVVTKVALKGLLSRKLRSVLTGFAVVIGVAFVVGTLVFTDTIDASFKNLFERTQQGVDVAVEARQAVKADFSQPPTMPADTLDEGQGDARRRAVAEGGVPPTARCWTSKGKAITSNGPPTLIVSDVDREGLPGPRLRRAAGRRRPPTRSRSTAARRRSTASRSGDTVTVTSRRAGQAVHGLRHRHARRQGQPRRRAAGRHDAARGAADDRPRRLRLDLGLDRRQHAGHGQGGAAEGARARLPRAHRQGGGRAAGAGPLGRARLHPDRAAGLRRASRCSSAAS